MSGLDWAGLMRVGIRGLGLSPASFWRLSPAELALMLGEVAGARPLTRARLNDLVARWPDEAKGTGDDRGRRAGRTGPAGGGA